MSTIGPAGYAAQLASSVARTNRADADASRLADAGQRQAALTASQGPEAIEEAAKAGLSTDRDPDGRRAWELSPPPDPEADDETPEEAPKPKITDTLDAIGGHLDIEV